MTAKNSKNIGLFTYWLPLLAGGLLTFIVAWAANYSNEHDVNLYTASLANKTENLIQSRFQFYEYGLVGTRAAIITVGINNINREQFKKYIDSRNISIEFPGALGFGLIKKVPPENEKEFIIQSRADGAPDFKIKTLTPHNNDRFVIQYIYPMEENHQAVGLDIGSERNRRSAALSSARDNIPYLTQPITLVQENKKPRKGVLILLPIYEEGSVLDNNEAREKAVVGWSYAPLIIDDILENLENFTNDASVTLTNISETEPFFTTNNTEQVYDSSVKLEREIFVLGQNWHMEVKPSIQAIEKAKSWNVGLLIATGLLLTLLTILIINLINTSEFGNQQIDDSYNINLNTIGAYLKSNSYKQLFYFSLPLLGILFAFSSWFIIENYSSSIKNNLNQSTKTAVSILDQESTRYNRDTLFLANSPALQILSELPDDIDASGVEKNSVEYQRWNKRLADIFLAYMLSNEDVYQVRLITATNNWQERVKVQRTGKDLKIFEQSQLQSKQSEPYINETLQAGYGNVYRSDINLNRELGKIEQPHRPVWRFSTPLFYSDGRPFGIIIINVNIVNILNSISNTQNDNIELYITNDIDAFLLHPRSSESFTFEYKKFNRWQDEFHPKPFFNHTEIFGLKSYVNQNNRIFLQHAIFSLADDSSGRQLNIYSVIPQFHLYEYLALRIGLLFLVIVFIGTTFTTVKYWLWLKETTRQNNYLKKEQQRNKEVQQFKSLLEFAPDAIIVTDKTGIITIVNAQAEKMFGYTHVELEGQHLNKLVPEKYRLSHKKQMMGYMHQPENRMMADKRKIFALKADGTEIPVEISLSYIKLEETFFVTASLRDISLRLTEEAKLNKALSDAKLATNAKSAFLANTSHEIRTPLNAVIGLSYLLAQEKLTEKQQQLVSKIQVSGKSLLGIVNDVLDLAKIEAHEMTIEEDTVELREFFEEVCSVFSIQAETKKLRFNLDLADDLPSWVLADSMRLRQILANLLSNALKFTTTGSISFHVELLTSTQESIKDKQGIRITVSDTGIGISSEAQSRLFNPFTQADSSTSRRFGGTGLGLSIVQELVHLMGGTIGVESATNQGSKFWVDLYFKVQTPDEVAISDNQNQTLFVLVAEDDPADANLLKKMIQSLGWRSEIVNNGADLIDAYMARIQDKSRLPDAIIVDYAMPTLNGLNTIKAITQKAGNENLCALLMVSAHDKEVINQEEHGYLIPQLLIKPISTSSLFNAVNQIVSKSTGNARHVIQATNAEVVGVKWLPNVRILIVDDHPINLTVISNVLRRNGALVQKANSGEEAVALLEKESNDYDAVLMDIQMSGMNGLEATQHIRNILGKKALPIIALTAGALLEEKNRALEAGMNDFLTKPIDPSKVIKVLRSSVEAYREKEIPIESLQPSTNVEEIWPFIDGLNMDQAKEKLLGDQNLFFKVLDSLLSEFANLASPPKVDIDDPKSTALRMNIASQSHKLRNVAGMIGAEDVQELASKAVRLLRTDHQPVKDTLNELSVALQELKLASTQELNDWKAKMKSKISIKSESSTLKLEIVTEIATLLEKQDLRAFELFNEHCPAFRKALGDKPFHQLQYNIDKLNYKEAMVIITPLIKRLTIKK
jgi:PAS domain S-box-containing protein